MKLTFMFSALVLTCACQTTLKTAKAEKKTANDIYHDRQAKLFESHVKELVKLGRVPEDFGGDAYTVLGQYGWHTRADISSVGGQAPLWLLQSSGNEGAFGAYTFYEPAFDQAKRTWVINGFMLPNSDLLWPMNGNAKFDKSVVGYSVEYLTQSGCYKDDGNTPCEDGMKNEWHELRDAHVVDVFGHSYEFESWGSDGSHHRGPEYWSGPLRLDKKAPAFMRQWRILIKPKDWVDMCACTTTTQSTIPAVTESVKPCVQGGTLMPGESCSSTIVIPGQ